ncbi:MAG TPA: hypothetical protein VI912_01215 [Candidatus Bilamarchaeaceae archaeon]|nr:hypothetical protein [Candidatus Bilamarchaeaceae archaeon]
MVFPEPFERKKVQSTNFIFNSLTKLDSFSFAKEAIDIPNLKVEWDIEKYEDKENSIPDILYKILKDESHPFSKLKKRTYYEEDAWFVSINSKECESLEEEGHDIFESFVKIRVPKVFVRALSLPMINFS